MYGNQLQPIAQAPSLLLIRTLEATKSQELLWNVWCVVSAPLCVASYVAHSKRVEGMGAMFDWSCDDSHKDGSMAMA